MARITDMPLEILHSIFVELAALEPPIGGKTPLYSMIVDDESFWNYRAHSSDHRNSPPGLRSLMRCDGMCKIWHTIIHQDYRASINRERQFFSGVAGLAETILFRYKTSPNEQESEDKYVEGRMLLYRRWAKEGAGSFAKSN